MAVSASASCSRRRTGATGSNPRRHHGLRPCAGAGDLPERPVRDWRETFFEGRRKLTKLRCVELDVRLFGRCVEHEDKVAQSLCGEFRIPADVGRHVADHGNAKRLDAVDPLVGCRTSFTKACGSGGRSGPAAIACMPVTTRA